MGFWLLQSKLCSSECKALLELRYRQSVCPVDASYIWSRTARTLEHRGSWLCNWSWDWAWIWKRRNQEGCKRWWSEIALLNNTPHAFKTGFANDWLEPKARREFDERTKCVAENLAEYKAEVPSTISCSIFTFEILHSFTAVGLWWRRQIERNKSGNLKESN